MSSSLRLGAYILCGLVALFELGVVWLLLHPDVPPDYRAYYIDKTTTCLNQPVSGSYSLGAVIPFTPEGKDAAKPIRVCGWEGPTGDGTHAVGTSARLRFAYAEPATALTLHLSMVAVEKSGHLMPQRVEIVANGTLLDTVSLNAPTPQQFSLALPAPADGRVELELRFPDAVQMGATDPDNRLRSIKLLSAALLPADQV
ncbi:hypothetical protein [Devosia sp.]|uniref:hypothetical protein n=1 Tax=Devosia sp. TaxID=1871048 RepID=UPI003F70406A